MFQLMRRHSEMRVGAAVVAAIAIASACTSKNEVAGDSTASSAMSSTSAKSVFGKPDKGIHGKPGDNDTVTRDYLLSLGWGDNLPDSQIVQTEFEFDQTSALVRIVPMVLSNEVSWQDALTAGADGHFVAKIYNLSNKPIGRLGLGPLGTGYVWVGEVNGPPGTRGVSIYSIGNDGKVDNSPRVFRFTGFCPGDHYKPMVALTDGKRCPEVATTTSASPARFILASQGGDTTPSGGQGLWVSCKGGCCEAQL
jgi:hypothetical protein